MVRGTGNSGGNAQSVNTASALRSRPDSLLAVHPFTNGLRQQASPGHGNNQGFTVCDRITYKTMDFGVKFVLAI